MKKEDIVKLGLQTLDIEIDALKRTRERVSDSFAGAVESIYNCKGRVVITGMGKSGLIGKKIAATLASTGTPSFFLHPAEGVHGDLGMLVAGDVVVALSNSGETDEIKTLLPRIKRMGLPLISIVGKVESTLAKKSDFVLDASVVKEACPLNLAPTASTTVSLALGDALAVALLERRGFRAEDFAMLHPSGSLGKRLLLSVEDVMHKGDELPIVASSVMFKEVLHVISSKRFGCSAVVNDKKEVVGIITDGDLRRAMEKFENPYSMNAFEIMTKNPKLIKESDLAAQALKIMEDCKISSLLVANEDKHLIGILHLQDLLKSGLV